MTAREPSAIPGRNPFRPDDGTCGRSFRSGSGHYRDCALPPHGPEVRHSAIGPASPAREPSAVEVIAEALHVKSCGCTASDEHWCPSRKEGLVYEREDTATVLAAIRAMSPSEQAELIGAEVQAGYHFGGRFYPSGAGDEIDEVRVVGPWREVSDV